MDQSRRVTIYSAGSSGRSLFGILRDIFRELPEAHELGARLFKRNLKAMYRQSLLGFVWAVVPPLITAALWIFLRGSNVMSVGDTGISYPVFVLIGTMMWQVFSEAMQSPIKNVVSNKAMLTKINIPREALLLSGIYEVLFNVLIKLGLLAIIFVVFKQPVGLSLLLVPVGILSLLLCGFSLGLIFTPVGVLYTDIQRGLAVVLPFLMYLTPVVYPKPKGGAVGLIMKLNPVASLLPETRNWFTGLPTENLQLFIIYSVGFLLLLLLGLVIYRLAMPMIIERIGS